MPSQENVRKRGSVLETILRILREQFEVETDVVREQIKAAAEAKKQKNKVPSYARSVERKLKSVEPDLVPEPEPKPKPKATVLRTFPSKPLAAHIGNQQRLASSVPLSMPKPEGAAERARKSPDPPIHHAPKYMGLMDDSAPSTAVAPTRQDTEVKPTHDSSQAAAPGGFCIMGHKQVMCPCACECLSVCVCMHVYVCVCLDDNIPVTVCYRCAAYCCTVLLVPLCCVC